MNADIKSPPFQFQLSEGYRSARRMTSLFCAIALAWSAAQFELKALSLGYFGNIDLSRAWRMIHCITSRRADRGPVGRSGSAFRWAL
jgi:hypothetical protein